MMEMDVEAGPSYDPEIVQAVAVSKGMDLSDEAAQVIADGVTSLLKHLIQDAAKFMHHSKRQKLTSADVEHALETKDVEPFYDFLSAHDASDFSKFEYKRSAKIPREVSFRAHWLAPDVHQRIEDMNATVPPSPSSLDASFSCSSMENHRLRYSERVLVKQLTSHQLSVEQQMYYRQITEACMGSHEPSRVEALQILATYSGLYKFLPQLSLFISEGVKVNVVERNLAFLIYLMRMVKSILENQTVYVPKYLHELIASICTCLVCKEISVENENHWILREFAGKLLSQICKLYSNPTNNIKMRLIRIFASAISNERIYITSLYGAIVGLATLGPEVVKVFVLPKIKLLSHRISFYSRTKSTAVGHLLKLLMRIIPPLIMASRPAPYNIEDFIADYGVLGPPFHASVCKARRALCSTMNI